MKSIVAYISVCLLFTTMVLAQYPGNVDLNLHTVPVVALTSETISQCTPSALNPAGHVPCNNWHTSNFDLTNRNLQSMLPCERRWFHTGAESAGTATAPRWGFVELHLRDGDNPAGIQFPNDEDEWRVAVWITEDTSNPPFSAYRAWGDWAVDPITETWSQQLCNDQEFNTWDGLTPTSDFYCRTSLDICQLEPTGGAYWVLVERLGAIDGSSPDGPQFFDVNVRVHQLEVTNIPYDNAAGTGALRVEGRVSQPFECSCGFPQASTCGDTCPGSAHTGVVPGFLPAYSHHFRFSSPVTFTGAGSDGLDLRRRLFGADLVVVVDGLEESLNPGFSANTGGFAIALRRGSFAMAQVDTDSAFNSEFFVLGLQTPEIDGCRTVFNSNVISSALRVEQETCAACGQNCAPSCTSNTEGDWYLAVALPSDSEATEGDQFNFNITISWENLPDLHLATFAADPEDSLGSTHFRVDRRLRVNENHYYLIEPTVEPSDPGGFAEYHGTTMTITIRGVTGGGTVRAHLTDKNFYPNFDGGCNDNVEYGQCTPDDVCTIVVYPCSFDSTGFWYLWVERVDGNNGVAFVEYGVEVRLTPEVVSEVSELELLTNTPDFADGAKIWEGPYVAYGLVHEYQYLHYTFTITPEHLADPTAYLAFEIFVDYEEDEVTVFVNDLEPGAIPTLAGHDTRLRQFDMDHHPVYPFDATNCHDHCYENLPQWSCRTNENSDHSSIPENAFDPQEPRIGFCHYKIERCQLQARQYYFSVYGSSKFALDHDGYPTSPDGHDNSYDVGVKFTATWYMGNATALVPSRTVNSGVHVPWANRPMVYSNQNFERVHYYVDVPDLDEDTVAVRVRIADVQNGVVEAFMAFNCLAGPCPCYHTHAHCSEDAFFDSSDEDESSQFCDLRLPFCTYGAGRYWVSVVGATASNPDREAGEPSRSTTFTVTPYIELAPAIRFVDVDDFGVPEVIIDTLAESEIHHYRLDYNSDRQTDILRIELKWVHESSSTNIQDVLVRLNRGTPATDDCFMHTCTATQNTRSDVSVADSIENTYSYCVIELRPCQFTDGDWYFTIENQFDDSNIETNDRVDYTLKMEVDERSITTLSLNNPIKSFVREASYAHFVLAYERRASSDSSLFAQLYVNRDIRQDIMFFINADHFAGKETDCYGSILLPCQTRYSYNLNSVVQHEQRETCQLELKACQIPVGQTAYYFSVLPDHGHDPVHGGAETVYGDQAIEFTLVVSTKTEERYTFDPTAQVQSPEDVTVIEGWPITGTVFQYISTGQHTENYYTVTVTNQPSSSSQTAFHVQDGDFLNVFLGNIQHGEVTAYFSENSRAVASCPCPNGWEWFRSSDSDHNQQFHSCRMFEEHPTFTLYLAVRAASQDSFFNSVSYTLRASINHITTVDSVEWDEFAEIPPFPYFNWHTVELHRPFDASPQEFLEDIFLRDDVGLDYFTAYLNVGSHGTPDCFIAKCSSFPSRDCTLVIPPCYTDDVFYLTIAPDPNNDDTDPHDISIVPFVASADPVDMPLNTFTSEPFPSYPVEFFPSMSFMSYLWSHNDVQPELTASNPYFHVVTTGSGPSPLDAHYLVWNALGGDNVAWPRNQNPAGDDRDTERAAAVCGEHSCEAVHSGRYLEYGQCDVASGRLPNSRPTLTVGKPGGPESEITILTDEGAGQVIQWPRNSTDPDELEFGYLQYRTVEVAFVSATAADSDTYLEFDFSFNVNVANQDDMDIWVYSAQQALHGPAHCMPEDVLWRWSRGSATGDACQFVDDSDIECSFAPCCLDVNTRYFVTVHHRVAPQSQDDIDNREVVTMTMEPRRLLSGTLGYQNPSLTVNLATVGVQPVTIPADASLLVEDRWTFVDTDALAADTTTEIVEFIFSNANFTDISLGVNGKAIHSVPWRLSGCYDPALLTCSLTDFSDICVIRFAACDVGLSSFAGAHFVIGALNSAGQPQPIEFDVEVHQWGVDTIAIGGGSIPITLSPEYPNNQYSGDRSEWNDHFFTFPVDRSGLDVPETSWRNLPGFRSDSHNILRIQLDVPAGQNYTANDLRMLPNSKFHSQIGPSQSCFIGGSGSTFDCTTNDTTIICDYQLCSDDFDCFWNSNVDVTVWIDPADPFHSSLDVTAQAYIANAYVRDVDIIELPLDTIVQADAIPDDEDLYYVELPRSLLSGQLTSLGLELETRIVPSLHLLMEGETGGCGVTMWPEWICENSQGYACTLDDDDVDSYFKCDLVVDPCRMTDRVTLTTAAGDVDLTGTDTVIWYARLDDCDGDGVNITASLVYPTINIGGDFDLVPGVPMSHIYELEPQNNVNSNDDFYTYHMYRFSLPDIQHDRHFTASIQVNPFDCLEDNDDLQLFYSFDDFPTSACHYAKEEGSLSIQLDSCNWDGGYVYVTVASYGEHSSGWRDGVASVYEISASVTETVYREIPKECAHVSQTSDERVYVDFSGEGFGTEVTIYVDVTESEEFWDSRDGDDVLQVWHPENEAPACFSGDWSCNAQVDDDIQEAVGGGCTHFLCSVTIPACEFATGRYVIQTRYAGSFVWVRYDSKEIPVASLNVEETRAWWAGQVRQKEHHFLGNPTWQFYQVVLEDPHSRPRLRVRVLDEGATVEVDYRWGSRQETTVGIGCANVGERDTWSVSGAGCLDVHDAPVTWPLDEYLTSSCTPGDLGCSQGTVNIAVRGIEAAAGCDTIHYEVEVLGYPESFQPLQHCEETCGTLLPDEVDYYVLDLVAENTYWNYGSVSLEMLYWEPLEVFLEDQPDFQFTFSARSSTAESPCDETFEECSAGSDCVINYVDNPQCASTAQQAIVSVRRVGESPSSEAACELAAEYSFRVCTVAQDAAIVQTFTVPEKRCVDALPVWNTFDFDVGTYEYSHNEFYAEVTHQPGQLYQVLALWEGRERVELNGQGSVDGDNDDYADLTVRQTCFDCGEDDSAATNELALWDSEPLVFAISGLHLRASNRIPVSVNLLVDVLAEGAVQDITETGSVTINVGDLQKVYYDAADDTWYDMWVFSWQPAVETLRAVGSIGFNLDINNDNENSFVQFRIGAALNRVPVVHSDCAYLPVCPSSGVKWSSSAQYRMQAYDGTHPFYISVFARTLQASSCGADSTATLTVELENLGPVCTDIVTVPVATPGTPREWASLVAGADWTTVSTLFTRNTLDCNDEECISVYAFTLPDDMERWDFVQLSAAALRLHPDSEYRVVFDTYAPLNFCEDTWHQHCESEPGSFYSDDYDGVSECYFELGRCTRTDSMLSQFWSTAPSDFWHPTDIFLTAHAEIDDEDEVDWSQYSVDFKLMLDAHPWKTLLDVGSSSAEVVGNVLGGKDARFPHYWRASSAGGAIVIHVSPTQGLYPLTVTVRDSDCPRTCQLEVVRTCKHTACRFEFITEADHSGADWFWITVEGQYIADNDDYDGENVYTIAAEAGVAGNCEAASSVFSGDVFCTAEVLPVDYLSQNPSVSVWTNGGSGSAGRHASAQFRYEQLISNWCPTPSPECEAALAQFSCLESFRSCDTELGFTQPLCSSLCDTVVRACATCGDTTWENKQNLFGVTDPRLEWACGSSRYGEDPLSPDDPARCTGFVAIPPPPIVNITTTPVPPQNITVSTSTTGTTTSSTSTTTSTATTTTTTTTGSIVGASSSLSISFLLLSLSIFFCFFY